MKCKYSIFTPATGNCEEIPTSMCAILHDRSKFKSFQIKYIKILSFHWVSSMCTLIFMNPSVLLSNTSNQHLHEDSKQNIPVPYVLRLVGLCKLRMENRRSWPTGLPIGPTGDLIKHFEGDLIKHFKCFFLVWFGDSHAILNRNDADVVGVRGGLFLKNSLVWILKSGGFAFKQCIHVC